MTAADDTLARLLRELGRRTGIGDLALDADGVCALAFDEDVVLHIAGAPDPDKAVFYARIGEIPEQQRLATYTRMLEANLADTGEATLSVDERDGRPLLVYRLAIGAMSYAEFEQRVEEVANLVQRWTAELAATPSDEGEAPTGEGAVILNGIRA